MNITPFECLMIWLNGPGYAIRLLCPRGFDVYEARAIHKELCAMMS